MTQFRYTNSVHLKLTHSNTRSQNSITRRHIAGIPNELKRENGLYGPKIVSSTIQYYTTVEFNVGSKAEYDQHMKLKTMPT